MCGRSIQGSYPLPSDPHVPVVLDAFDIGVGDVLRRLPALLAHDAGAVWRLAVRSGRRDVHPGVHYRGGRRGQVDAPAALQ